MRFDNDLQDSDPQEREISLGTATILGIFLALALVCAAFFGFGYSLGHHASPASTVPTPEAKSDKTDSPFSDFKSPAKPHTDDGAVDSQTDPASSSTSSENTAAPVAAPQDAPRTSPPARTVAFPIPSQPAASAAPAHAIPVASAGQLVVQVSATSRQGDAEALIAVLRQKGYTAAIRQEPQDKLFHVQIGPFATKKDADAMRQRLDTDGYKAIVK